MFLEISQNSQKNTFVGVSFSIKFKALACSFIKKETLAQVFSIEFLEISENAFSENIRWLLLKWQSDFQTKCLKRKRERERERERDLKSAAADRI